MRKLASVDKTEERVTVAGSLTDNKLMKSKIKIINQSIHEIEQ
jgi:hypothetical protein